MSDGWAPIEHSIARSKKLTVYEKLVYIVIKGHLNDNGLAFPSQQTLADEIGCSREQVRRALTTLKKQGYIEAVNTRQHNYYRITLMEEVATDVGNVADEVATVVGKVATDVGYVATVVGKVATDVGTKNNQEEEQIRKPNKKNTPATPEDDALKAQRAEVYTGLRLRRKVPLPKESQKQEAPAITRMLRAGHDPPKILACYDDLKAGWWSDKTLYMWAVEKQIPEWRPKNGRNQAKPKGAREADYSTWLPKKL